MAEQHPNQPHWTESLTGEQVDAVEQEREIRKIQESISRLQYDNDGRSAHFGDNVSPGCSSCKMNKWVTVFLGRACNASCSFCPQPPKPVRGSAEDEDVWISTSFGRERYEELKDKLISAALQKSIISVGYSGGEPLMYIDRVESFAKTLDDRCPNLYQYIYTNGILFEEKIASRLSGIGIREIRFDLAATNFAPKIIRKLKLAGLFFSRVGIEIPSIPGTLNRLMGCISQIIDAGVSQINLCEVVINRHNVNAFTKDSYYIHNIYEEPFSLPLPVGVDPIPYRRIVPIESRRETYRILNKAHTESWPITINDCSQAVHYKPKCPY